jgi:hypothetical protein
MIDLDKLEPALAMKIAENILHSLSKEERETILAKAIAGSLEGWNFKHEVVDKACAVKGADMLVEFLVKPRQETEMRAAIQKGWDMYIEALPGKICAGLVEMLHGRVDLKGSYHHYGSILRLMEVKG